MSILRRADWQARPARARTSWQSVNGFTIHWMGGKPWTDTVRLVQSLQRDAMREGYSDIEYNWLVATDGTIVEGRGWDVRSGANYSPYANAHHIAVCYLAGPGIDLTVRAQQSIAAVIAEGQRRHPSATEVVPHSHWRQTECPGDQLRTWIAHKGWERHAITTPTTPAPRSPYKDNDDMRLMCRSKGSKAVYIIDGMKKRGPLTQEEVDTYAFTGIATGRRPNGTVGEVHPTILNRLKAA